MRETATKFTTLRLPTSLPASQKMYIQGSRPDLRVPYREIKLSSTKHSRGLEENPPIPVYDCSRPYSDPDSIIDLAQGVPKLRQAWVNERRDTEILSELTSEYGRQRANDLLTHEIRFPVQRRPRRALPRRNVSQMHYARKGIVTPEMEFVALRESMRLHELQRDPAYAALLRAHPGRDFGARLGAEITPEFVRDEVAAGRAIIPANINHPELEPMNIGCNFKVKIDGSVFGNMIPSSYACARAASELRVSTLTCDKEAAIEAAV